VAFTQDLFSSRRNNNDGTTRIGEQDRLWYEPQTNTIRVSDGITPGGIIVGSTGGGNGNVTTNNYSNVNVAAYLSYTATTGNLDLGNLYISDETLGGKIANRDITLRPNGTGLVSVPGLKVPVGSVLQGVSNIVAVITTSAITNVLRSSTGPSDNLNIGDYGLTNGISGVTPGWNVFSLSPAPGATIQVGDTIVGTGIPYNSTVLFVGNVSGTDSANANIIITNNTLNSLPPLEANTLAFTTRAVVNAGLAITTTGNVDITLNPGIGGNIVPAGSFIPLVDDTYDLGAPNKRYRHVWVGAGTIYILDETLGTDQTIGARDGNLYIGGGTGLTVGKFTLFGNTIALANTAEDFRIGTQSATGNLIINRPIRINSPAGDNAFTVTRYGLTTIHSPIALTNTQAVFSIIGTSSGNVQPRNFANTMIQVTGNDNVPNRISFDAFGVTAGQNAYTAISARAARGTVDSPSTTQAGDTILRFTGQGWANNGAFVGSIIRLNLEAAETFTSNASTGTRLTIQTTPVGSNIIQTTAAFYANGLSLFGNTQTGIKFTDGTFQNTAFQPSNWVRQITTGTGFANTGTFTGNVSLDTTDVHSLISDSYSLTVSDTGSNNLKLHLAQEISSNSSPIFNNLTVSNLTVNGTFTTAINASINGKILYLANNSTSSSQIDGGGIILGNSQQSYYKSILYDLANNWWSTDGSGLDTELLSAHDGDFVGNVYVTGTILAGGAAKTVGNLFPNAGIQVFENVNSYAQIVEQNLSTGTKATTDFIATADNGTDTTYYIDMGIAGSNYDNSNPNNSLGTSLNANDGYLYVQGDLDADAAVDGGDLILGTATAGKDIKFIVGGVNDTNVKVTFSNTTIDSYNNYVLHDGNDNILLQLQNDGGIGKLTFTGGSQGIWYNSGIYINGIGYHSSYSGIQALSYNSATGQVTYGQIDASQILNAYGNINVAAYLAGNVTIGNLTVSNLTVNGTLTTGNVAVGGTFAPAKGITHNATKPTIVGNVVLINFDTDDLIHVHTTGPGTTITANLVNLSTTVGKTVEVLVMSSAGGSTQFNHGVASSQSTNGYSFFLTSHQTMYVKYFNIDGTTGNLFVTAIGNNTI